LLDKAETLARKKQLKDRLSDWGFEKNIKGDIMIQIAWTELMRKRTGKRSVFRFNERVVREKKIARYLKRYKISDEDLLSMPCPVKGMLFFILHHRKY